MQDHSREDLIALAAGLSAAEKAVLGEISRQLSGAEAEISYSRLARRTGLARRTVIRVVGRLVWRGYLRLIRAGRSRSPNAYRINFDALK